MRTPLEYLDRIDQFINGGMSQEEKLAFETELKLSEQLQQTYNNQLLIQQAVHRKAILAQVEMFAPKVIASNVFWTKFKWPIILSSIVLAIVSGFAINSKFEKQSQKKIVSQNSGISQGKKIQKPAIISSNNNHSSYFKNSTFTLLPNPSISDNTTLAGKSVSNPYKVLDGLQTWIKPEIQYFTIDPTKSATIEGKDGTLIIIPANTAIDQNGNKVTESIQVELVEALTIDKMLAYNLTTTSNDKALTSGGMIYIQPKLNGEKLSFSENKPIHIEIPCDEYHSEMKAWQGVTDANGNVNWTNPQDIENFLIPVDFTTLDFVPATFRPQFQSQLPFQNYLKSTVALEDSFYYSLSHDKIEDQSKQSKLGKGKFADKDYLEEGEKTFGSTSTIVIKGYNFIGNGKEQLIIIRNNRSDSYDIDKRGFVTIPLDKKKSLPFTVILQTDVCDSMIFENVTIAVHEVTKLEFSEERCKSTSATKKNSCYIDPSAIKALRQNEFAKTFIATKEFEDRLKELHKLKQGQEMLELYVYNLPKNMHEIDQMVADKLDGNDKFIFENFAKQKHTNVDLSNLNLEELQEYYNESRKKYQEEVKERNDQLVAKTQNELSILSQKLNDLNDQYYSTDNENGNVQNLNFNLPQFKRSVSRSNSYKVSWNGTGWMNIDAFLHELEKGEKVLAINTGNQNEGERIYQCINSLNTVIGLNKIKGEYGAHYPSATNPFSSKFQTTYCVGISKTTDNVIQFASTSFDPYSINIVPLTWEAISEDELIVRLKNLSPANKDLINSLQEEKERIRLTEELKTKQEEIQKEMKAILDEQKKREMFLQKLKDCIDPCKEKSQEIKVVDEKQTVDVPFGI